jgi:hypothetical protein
MRIFLFTLAILSFLGGFEIYYLAKNAIQEIEAFILFLISAVFISGGSIVGAINHLKDDKQKQVINVDQKTGDGTNEIHKTVGASPAKSIFAVIILIISVILLLSLSKK